MVDLRDHDLMTSLRPDSRLASAFLSRYPSTNGPFQIERAMMLSIPLYYSYFRRRIIWLVEAFFLLRVFLPFVFLPHGVHGWRPPEVRPSPPP